MRKLFLRLSILSAIILGLVYAFGRYFSWFWEKFGDAAQVQNTARQYLLISAIFFAGLYLAKNLIGICLLILAVILALLLFQFDILHWLNIVG